MSHRRQWWFPNARIALPAVLLLACVKVWTPAVRPPGAVTTTGPAGIDVPSSNGTVVPQKTAPTLKVHLNNRQLWILSRWQEDATARMLSGYGELYAVDRTLVGSDTMRVPFDSIALLESYGASRKASFGLGLLSVYMVGTGLITGSCLADPKSCFGSCPTFYVAGDTGVVQAEGFSGSPLRVLEERDVDHLFRLDPPAGPFVIAMRNEALETHAVRQVRLHVVSRPPGGRVFQTPDGAFRPATHITAPSRCTAANGDCVDRVRALDDASGRHARTPPTSVRARWSNWPTAPRGSASTARNPHPSAW